MIDPDYTLWRRAHQQSLGCAEWTFHREKVLLQRERSFCVSSFSSPPVERGAGLASGSAGCSELFAGENGAEFELYTLYFSFAKHECPELLGRG